MLWVESALVGDRWQQHGEISISEGYQPLAGGRAQRTPPEPKNVMDPGKGVSFSIHVILNELASEESL